MPVIGDAELKRDTEILSSDAFGGRLPGTPGGDRTVAYMIAGMRTAGLQPGNHGRWTQDVPLVTITADPHFALDVAGKGHDEKFVQNADIVLWTKRHDGHGLLANSSIIFAGYGIHAPERGWDDYAGVDVHGKTVIVLVNDPDWQSAADTGTFGGRRLTYYGRWTYRSGHHHSRYGTCRLSFRRAGKYQWRAEDRSGSAVQGRGPRRSRRLDIDARCPAPFQGGRSGPFRPD